jgi:glutamate carboxypeptidase
MLEKVIEYLDAHEEEFIEFWRDFVNHESLTAEVENVRACAEFAKKKFEEAGFECELVEVGKNGPSVVGNLGKDRKGKHVVLAGHMDTVHAKGSFGEPAFKIKDGWAYGPGVADMKGGLVVAWAVAKALTAAGYEGRPLRIVMTGDEETGHLGSIGAKVYVDACRGGVCGFNLEPGNPSGKLVVGKRGMYRYRMKVYGVSAHAGRNFDAGRNAILEACHKIFELAALTDPEKGITVNVGTIKGGTVANAVPDYCEFEIDTRYTTRADVPVVRDKIMEICNRTHIDGTHAECELISNLGVYETTDDVMRFYNFIDKIAKRYNLSEGGKGYETLGSSSDAALVQEAGVPTICSCGVNGLYIHTTRECAVVDSLKERAKMVAAVIINIDEFDPE